MTSNRRLIALAALLIGLFAVGKLSGLTDAIDAERIRSAVKAAGPWGFALYVGVFAAGLFLHIPGMIFVAAGVLAYGKAAGFPAALFASVGSVCFSFGAVRVMAGKPLVRIERPFVRRMLGRLDSSPIKTVVALRLVLWLAPGLNYALALSSLRFRDYLLGSFLGLIVPVGAATLLFDWFFS